MTLFQGLKILGDKNIKRAIVIRDSSIIIRHMRNSKAAKNATLNHLILKARNETERIEEVSSLSFMNSMLKQTNK